MSETANRENTRKILFVTPVSPFATASGAEQRSSLMLSALSGVGQVDVLQLRPDEQTGVFVDKHGDYTNVIALVPASNSPFKRYTPKADLTRDIERLLGCKISDYRLIVGRYVWPVCQLVIPSHVPVIVDLDDFRYRYSGQTPWSLALVKERLGKALSHGLVRKQLSRFNGAFTVSEQDNQEISGLPTAFLPNVPMHTLSNTTPVPNSKNVVFVGSLWYGPNKDGINWFLKQVWPHVLRQEPTATLTLAGAAPPTLRARWETQSGVSAHGFAPDLAALYQHANLVVVPVQSGGGTNIKVLEAMAHGRPGLVSSFVAAAFGHQFTDTKELLVAKNAEEFCTKTLSALHMMQNIQGVADSGHLAVNQHFTLAQFQSRIKVFVLATIMTSANARTTQP